jgi:hypothetical protein
MNTEKTAEERIHTYEERQEILKALDKIIDDYAEHLHRDTIISLFLKYIALPMIFGTAYFIIWMACR